MQPIFHPFLHYPPGLPRPPGESWHRCQLRSLSCQQFCTNYIQICTVKPSGLRFSSKYDMQPSNKITHKKSTCIRPFCCDICQCKFRTSTNLNTQLRLHYYCYYHFLFFSLGVDSPDLKLLLLIIENYY